MTSIDLTNDTLFDPTVPAPPVVDVATHGFEGRLDALADDWSADARYWEYSKAANPIGAGFTTELPAVVFPAALHGDGPSRAIPLDLAEPLRVEGGPATSPALLASFVRVNRGDRLALAANATSQLYYVMYGRGTSVVGGRVARWEKGDFIVLPAVGEVVHHADADTVMYWVHDEPLLRYLGVRPDGPKFRPPSSRASARSPSWTRSPTPPGRTPRTG